jgi:alpha-tubulin suppressor-like RCC1 family protein
MKKKFLLCVISSCLALALCGSPAACAAGPAPAIDRQTIAAGEGFTAVIKENGDLYTFGGNSAGELGNGFIYDNSEYKCLMTSMKMMSGVAAVYAGTSNCCAITESGSLYCWGSNEFGDVGNGEVCGGS